MKRIALNGIALTAFLAFSLFAQTLPDNNAPALMPWPASMSVQPGGVAIDSTFSISASGAGAKDPRVQDAIDRTLVRLARQTGIPVAPHAAGTNETATLRIVVEERDHRPPQRLGDDERYSLEVSGSGIRLSADAPLGALRGLETFLQLIQQNTKVTGTAPASPGFSVPDVTIRDEPRFEWRGLSLDVSRHFIPAADVERTIDGLAAVKLNVLHWHLSDDQGFRVESQKYRRLQQYGSNGLFYTQREIRNVIAYARERGVRIVPEFDMPGHATSWLPGYPKLGTDTGPYEIGNGYGILSHLMDPTKESTYRFLDGFMGEMAKLFPDEYFHIGGDEVAPKEWNDNPRIQAFLKKHHLADAKALQAYFNQRLLKIVSKHGKHMEGWDEVLHPDLPKTVIIQSWRGQESLWQAAREGYQGILSAGYYLDLMQPASEHYAIDPMKLPPERKKHLEEEGRAVPTELTAEEKTKILGGEAAMWEELATAENLDAKLWPRLAAIAERFWSPEGVTDVGSMYRRLEVTNRWLEWLGLTQRSGLELMRQRLAGGMPYQALDVFASLLEPVRGYSRHADRYTTSTPLNRLVDSIAPESDTAREFRNAVDQYLAAPKEQRNSEALKEQLLEWIVKVSAARAVLERNSLLSENIVAADTVIGVCKIGSDALLYLDPHLTPPSAATAAWKQRSLAAVEEAAKRQGDVLIAIVPGVQKLVEAVEVGTAPAEPEAGGAEPPR
ncbi:MAG: family 20 glycosylhydrolase [Acidobacteriaceae bacterium]|nr:family 20 glycosylhydrolase [Acidobacteriaceae bacterium]